MIASSQNEQPALQGQFGILQAAPAKKAIVHLDVIGFDHLPMWLSLSLIMATERDYPLQYAGMRLDGKNYSYWSYVMKNSLKGKKLEKYEMANEVSDHLQRLHTQSNFAKQCQLKIDIRAIQQNNMSVKEFYFAMTNLWDELALTESDELKIDIAHRKQQRFV